MNVQPTDLLRLRDAVMSVWSRISKECFQHLIVSMPQRIQAVLGVKVGRYLFAGEYENAIGTCVIFEEKCQDCADLKPVLKYKCHTMKKLMLQRTFLSECRKQDEPVSNRIEVLALNEGEVFGGRAIAVCHYLDPSETEKSVLDESKVCEGSEMSDESPAEMDETEAGTVLLDNFTEETIDTTVNASICSLQASTQEGDVGS
ncbi:general transcription factor 3C polypeptide 6-like isoform X2 [Myxocyprinus asiaticus]|uniref:general transcription factor 3C polypeptide 6-like isoform X2 n=1 Tax=Myxocyprinus asiaticus TaxID=70543 RepID=UPI002221EB2B|nr:general transcription factor 3C polypeptide 6-like isoform X2 [Myxocyprinus asiaticus]